MKRWKKTREDDGRCQWGEDIEGWPVDDDDIDDDEEDEDMEKNYMAAGGHMERSADGISELLKDIKGLLSSRQQEKQEYAEISRRDYRP